MYRNQQNRFEVKRDVTLFNRLNNESITGDLINEAEIEGKKFFVLRVGGRSLKLAKDAYTTKRALLTLTSVR